MAAKVIPFPFSAGPLAMPSIRLKAGDPLLAPDVEQLVCLPQRTQMPNIGTAGSMWPFLRRIGESCLFTAKAMPPVLSDLLAKDNTGPSQLHLNLDGRKPIRSRKR